MRPGSLVLFTDQSDGGGRLAEVLDQIAPCHVLTVADGAADVPTPCLGLVADLDLLRPVAVERLRALVGVLGRPGPPLICLSRRMGERSLAEARALGAALSLPVETAPDTVAEALLAHLKPGTSLAEAKVARCVERAGEALNGLLGAARGRHPIDAAAVEDGLAPILTAVGTGGLACWLETVRSYDDATYQHCLLVAGLAAQFSIDLGFSATDRQHLVRAALVHDIGKARIPLEILNKPRRLDPAEMAVMRTHPAVGHEILVAAGGFDALTLSVVRHHHEMLDGSGYPDGLSGSEIIDAVRLTTICDIYAALVERRPYRAPMPNSAAMAILRGMGDKLDRDLVRAFAQTVVTT